MVVSSLQRQISSAWCCKFSHRICSVANVIKVFLEAWMVLECSRHLTVKQLVPSFPGWMNGDYDVNSAAIGNFLMLKWLCFLAWMEGGVIGYWFWWTAGRK